MPKEKDIFLEHQWNYVSQIGDLNLQSEIQAWKKNKTKQNSTTTEW